MLFFCVELAADSRLDANSPAVLRMIRIYGDNELEPPILIIGASNQYLTNVGSDKITVELDVYSNVPPNLYAKFVHHTVDWRPTENLFYQDISALRFSNIQWESSTYINSYFSYRGKMQFPDIQIKFKHSGNWKVMFYEYGNDKVEFASAKFFVVNPIASADISIWNNMYRSQFNVSSTALQIETVVTTRQSLIDNNVHTCVLYKNNRWEEPLVITDRTDVNKFEYLYRYSFNRMVRGFISARKIFRIEGVPSENEYRVLDLSNLAYFPRTTEPIRLPFSDWRRNGTFAEYDDEGAMVANHISSVNDDYVLVEFLLDPDGVISNDDVFLLGSFNNWTPTAAWQMYFDEYEWFYKLRQWVRRGRHNYLYATGTLNIDLNRAVRYSTDEYEGNTTLNSHFYIAFIYYHDVSLGGFDSIIAVAKQDIARKY